MMAARSAASAVATGELRPGNDSGRSFSASGSAGSVALRKSERQRFTVRQLDFVEDVHLRHLPGGGDDGDVAIECRIAIKRAELVDRKMFYECGDGAVAAEIALERGGVARRRDDVAARENVSVRMNDEAAA